MLVNKWISKSIVDKLDKDCLLECALQSEDDMKVVDSYFNKDLEQAIESVSNSLDKTTLKDDIDLVIKENVRKIYGKKENQVRRENKCVKFSMNFLFICSRKYKIWKQRIKE